MMKIIAVMMMGAGLIGVSDVPVHWAAGFMFIGAWLAYLTVPKPVSE